MARRRDGADVRIRGLKELDRALGKTDTKMRGELRAKLRDAADVVAEEARQLAGQRTTRRTGDLLRGIRPFAATGRAGVRSSATHGGYSYPARLEYEGRAGRPYGPRASLNPAADARIDDVIRETEQLLDELADTFHGGFHL